MKKFKEFKVNATENKIVQNEVISHLTKLGYDSSGLKGGLYLIYESGRVAWVSYAGFFATCIREELTLDEFFKLTPEDVVIEPELIKCVFNVAYADPVEANEDGLFMGGCFELSEDQIGRIKSIMDEES